MFKIVELKSRKKDFVSFDGRGPSRPGTESTNHGADTAETLSVNTVTCDHSQGQSMALHVTSPQTENGMKKGTCCGHSLGHRMALHVTSNYQAV